MYPSNLFQTRFTNSLKCLWRCFPLRLFPFSWRRCIGDFSNAKPFPFTLFSSRRWKYFELSSSRWEIFSFRDPRITIVNLPDEISSVRSISVHCILNCEILEIPLILVRSSMFVTSSRIIEIQWDSYDDGKNISISMHVYQQSKGYWTKVKEKEENKAYRFSIFPQTYK